MANRKKAVLEIIAREGEKEESEDGFVRRGFIYRELSKQYPFTHLRTLNAILTAHERRGKIEPFWKNRFVMWPRKRWRIPNQKKNEP